MRKSRRLVPVLFTVRVEADVAAAIQRIATAQDRKPAAVIRRLLRKALEVELLADGR